MLPHVLDEVDLFEALWPGRTWEGSASKKWSKGSSCVSGKPRSQKSSGPRPLFVAGVLPAEGSVLLDVLQRFKGGALRDEPSPGRRDGFKKKEEEMKPTANTAARLLEQLCVNVKWGFSAQICSHTHTHTHTNMHVDGLVRWRRSKSQSFHQNTLSAMSIKAKVHQFCWQTEEPFRVKQHSEQHISISEQRVHLSLLLTGCLFYYSFRTSLWRMKSRLLYFCRSKPNAHRNVRQKSSSYVQPKSLERPLLVGWKTVPRLFLYYQSCICIVKVTKFSLFPALDQSTHKQQV